MNIDMLHKFLHVIILMIFMVACSVPAASSPAAQTIIASFADPNLGIDLAGYIMQQVSGESFADHERDH